MTRKQLLIILGGTAVLALVVLLMISSLLVAVTSEVTSASGREAEQVESAGAVSSLSGGNDCYCIPPSDPDTPTPATE